MKDVSVFPVDFSERTSKIYFQGLSAPIKREIIEDESDHDNRNSTNCEMQNNGAMNDSAEQHQQMEQRDPISEHSSEATAHFLNDHSKQAASSPRDEECNVEDAQYNSVSVTET